ADGVVSIARFTRAELAAAGIPQELLDLPGYVPAAGVLADVYGFDAAFFDLSPREADWTDPQQRLFLECSWEALEDAGHGPGSAAARRERIGVLAGMGMGTYLLAAGEPARAFPAGFGLQAMLGNDKDFLPTRVSYKLDLKGPSVGVQTACSTALVAVHLACKA